ncbi:hypothetical protein [Gilvibacter sp.]|uniref:hypothetical protein n=1 Tax=Gilvibacter sp. TaxID=2729997 RepID=UPI0025BE3652|nr:hypothetical protein [Gilvibacter sp.]NQX78630.1 hypothetical protein [Gilvibacter sp.]
MNTAFTSKHADTKKGAAIGQVVGQTISGITAYFAVLYVLPFENTLLKSLLAISLAILPELIIFFIGKGAVLPVAEWLGGKKAYEIQDENLKLSWWANLVKVVIFTACFITTAYLTFTGSFEKGERTVSKVEKPQLSVLQDSFQRVADSIFVASKENTSLVEDEALKKRQLEELRARLAFDRSEYDRLQAKYNKDQLWTTEYSRLWRFKLKPNEGSGEKVQEAAIEAKLVAWNIASKAISEAKGNLFKKADDKAQLFFNERLAAYESYLREKSKNGSRWQFFGMVFQVLVLLCLIVQAIIDLGENTIVEKERHYLDGTSVIGERLKVAYYRWKEKSIYKIAELSKRPLLVKASVGSRDKNKIEVDIYNPDSFSIHYLTNSYVADYSAAPTILLKDKTKEIAETADFEGEELQNNYSTESPIVQKIQDETARKSMSVERLENSELRQPKNNTIKESELQSQTPTYQSVKAGQLHVQKSSAGRLIFKIHYKDNNWSRAQLSSNISSNRSRLKKLQLQEKPDAEKIRQLQGKIEELEAIRSEIRTIIEQEKAHKK